jgi:hypothetical protein
MTSIWYDDGIDDDVEDFAQQITDGVNDLYAIERDKFEADQRMRALAAVYQTTLSILATERVRVLVEEHPHMDVAAWTNGLDITVNSAHLSELDFEEIVRVHGLVFHELCHVRYTPRKGTNLVTDIIGEGITRAFNVLEDQRIETLLTNKYRSTIPWLTAAILRWVVGRPDSLPSGLLYVHGRRFLPADVRRLFNDSFGFGLPIEPGRLAYLKQEAKVIIDEYRTLVFPSDYDRALSLTRRFHLILTEIEGSGHQHTCPHGHHELPTFGVPDKGRPKGVQEQRKDRDAGDTSPLPNEPEAEADDEDQTSGQGQQDGDEDDEGQSGGDDDGDSGGLTGEGRESRTNTNNDDTSAPPDDKPAPMYPQAGIGHGSDDPIEPEDQAAALDKISDALQEILNSREVRDEVRSAQQRLRGGNRNEFLKKARVLPGWSTPPGATFKASSKKMIEILNRLTALADPGWVRQVDSGRVNPVRWFTDRDPDTAYDRWDEGVHDATDLEVVLLLDVSGSMGWAAVDSHHAMWAIKNALDSIDAATTVITYDDECKILYSSNERAGTISKYAFTAGGTDPTEGLNQAARIFAHSKRANKILITLTDGHWYTSADEFGMSADDYIKKMRFSGVTTALGFIMHAELALTDPEYVRSILSDERMQHGCEVVGVAGGQDLVPFIRRVVESAIRRRLSGAA